MYPDPGGGARLVWRRSNCETPSQSELSAYTSCRRMRDETFIDYREGTQDRTKHQKRKDSPGIVGPDRLK